MKSVGTGAIGSRLGELQDMRLANSALGRQGLAFPGRPWTGDNMTEEKPAAAAGATDAPSSSLPGATYPQLPPPPSYNAAVSAVPGTGQLPNGTIIAGVSNPNFIALPAARYDTMTSYLEEGSGIQTITTTGVVLDRPIMVKCPFCMMTVTTETKPTTGCLTWLCCMTLVVVGCVYGCCLIPFCSRRLRDVEHICPHCHHTVAMYKRI